MPPSHRPAPQDRIGEISAPQRSAARYRPERELPPYRYVPGLHPHPLRDEDGHSYQPPGHAPRPALDGRGVADEWLWGVDLFNAFYFWESHEAWEGLWGSMPRDSAPARAMQGLIQVAAALLKTHMGSADGAHRLSRHGLEKLAQAAAASPRLLGLELRPVVTDFETYFRPLATRTLPPLDASVPLLLPALDLLDRDLAAVAFATTAGGDGPARRRASTTVAGGWDGGRRRNAQGHADQRDPLGRESGRNPARGSPRVL